MTDIKDYKPWTVWFPNHMQSLKDLERRQDQQSLQGQKVGFDIAFLHGLQLGNGINAHEKTWTNSNKVCWPRDWLPHALAEYLKGRPLRILGISYNAQASWCRTGAYGVVGGNHKAIAKSLFSHLVDLDRCSLGGRPFVLVGHSYGGIVLRSLVVYCNDLSKLNPGGRYGSQSKLARRFMYNLKGCIYFGVPQRGSKLANRASHMSMCIPKCIAEIVRSDLVTSSPAIIELDKRFEDVSNDLKVKQYAFGETKPTKFMFLALTVVDHASAKGQLHSVEIMPLPGTDHRTVNKFRSESCSGFLKFTSIVGGLIQEDQERTDAMECALRSNPQEARTRISDPNNIPALTPRPEEDKDVAVIVAKRVEDALPPDVRFADNGVKDLLVHHLLEKFGGLINSVLPKVIENCKSEEIGSEPRLIEEEHVLSAIGGDCG